MYPYDFRPRHFGINHREIFVAMPFDQEFDPVYDKLIEPATISANKKLEIADEKLLLYPYRTKDDIRTTSGWINVLEHLFTAQIVMGVLTSRNPNVFYELGIAHATQPIARQILLAEKGYERTFDTKDLIYYEYDGSDYFSSIEPLADRMIDAIRQYELEQEKKIRQAKMLIGPYDFEVLFKHGSESHFALHSNKPDFTEEYEKRYGIGSFKRHIFGISNLCQAGLLGLNTVSHKSEGMVNVEFSYWWTNLGNDVLRSMDLIIDEELKKRRQQLPEFFE
jgi:hypothetical protein